MRASDTRQSEPIVLVNEALAREAWPGQDPLGRRLRISEREPWSRVVGVVGDIRHLGPSVPPRPEIYQADSQNSFPFMAFVVRTSGEPYATVPSIRRAVTRRKITSPLTLDHKSYSAIVRAP